MKKSSRPVAVVTASTAGIGYAIAKALAKDGYHVVISSRKAENVALAVRQVRAKYGQESSSGLICHVGRADDRAKLLQHALARSEYIHALVLNAAVSVAYGDVIDTTEAQWDKTFDVNVKSSFLLVKQFVPYFKRGSSVVFVSSIAGYRAWPGVGAYSVSKTTLLGLCKVLSVELGRRGVRVNGVAPGIIRTEFSRKLWEGHDSMGNIAIGGKATDGGHADIPIRRFGEPSDVSGVVAFLISEKAAYISGETVVIAGGAHSKL